MEGRRQGGGGSGGESAPLNLLYLCRVKESQIDLFSDNDVIVIIVPLAIP